jgi:hypothetical protein
MILQVVCVRLRERSGNIMDNIIYIYTERERKTGDYRSLLGITGYTWKFSTQSGRTINNNVSISDIYITQL